ncbi:hypothetical protein [Hyphobacterium sp.]|uniref:hypothetical protein n=1 Tax=Hyphobacterium sp. TaxID=2004662 RepID=UPI003B520722
MSGILAPPRPRTSQSDYENRPKGKQKAGKHLSPDPVWQLPAIGHAAGIAPQPRIDLRPAQLIVVALTGFV